MSEQKPRVIKDFDVLEVGIQEQIKLAFPYGFDRALITFKNIKGAFVSALPFETEDRYYLVRMTKAEAQEIIEADDDYDDDGNLKEDVMEDYTEKYEEDEGSEEIIDNDTDD